MRLALLLVIGCCCFCFVSGCSRDPSDVLPLAPADGTVKFRGSPLAGATVTFMPEKGPLAQGVTDLEGKFTIKTGTRPGATIGPVNVTVTADQPGNSSATDPIFTKAPQTPAEKEEYMKKAGEMGRARAQGNATQTASASVIPTRYNKPQTSGLSYTIKADGDNHFPIELQP
jgi:hypothetical protein